MARAPSPRSDSVAVIGLGRFGGAVAESLVRLGHDVLGIDVDAELVQSWADRLTHVVQADTTDGGTLRRLGVQEFAHAVVGIGGDIEASVLTVLALSELGVEDIWAKALGEKHGRILERTGAHHVVYPEAAMGGRVAHLVTGKMIDFIEFDDGFAIVKTRAPREAEGRTLAESALRSKYGVTVVGVKRAKTDFAHGRPETPIQPGDLWSDDPRHEDYNLMVRAPYPHSHERLRRADPLYDLVILTGWNWPRAERGRGSAIFVHRWRGPGRPTEGCVGLRPQDLAWVARRISVRSRLVVR